MDSLILFAAFAAPAPPAEFAAFPPAAAETCHFAAFTPPVPAVAESPRPAKIPATAVAAVTSMPAGWHSHTCPKCGTTWSHGEENFGNQAAHTCPNCGTVQYAKSPAAQAQPVYQLQQARQPATNYNNCPNGQCPLTATPSRGILFRR